MRTLHADLTSAQQAASATPYIHILLVSRNRATSYDYYTTDTPNLISSIVQAESSRGEDLGVDRSYPISSVITLKDPSNALSALDLRGYRVSIEWGYYTVSGYKASRSGPMFVVTQVSHAEEGELSIDLRCSSLFNMAALRWANQFRGTTQPLEFSGTAVRQIMQEILVGGSFGPEPTVSDGGIAGADRAAVLYCLSAYQNYMDEIDSPDLNDTPLLGPVGSVADGDCFYWGMTAPFDSLTVDMGTPAVGDYAITYEVWDGATWSAVSMRSASAVNKFQTSGLNPILFCRPTTWATLNLSGTSAEFPNQALYYLRARVNLFVSLTTQPKANRIFVNQDFAVTLDTSDAAQDDGATPTLEIPGASSILPVIEAALNSCELSIKTQDDGFHLFYSGSTTLAYTYGTTHKVHIDLLEKTHILPNTFYYYSTDPTDRMNTVYTNSASDASSVAALGAVATVAVETSITSDADALVWANHAVARAQARGTSGSIVVPMNCGQEIGDYIEIVDSRNGLTYHGRVTTLTRRFDAAERGYSLSISLGGIQAEGHWDTGGYYSGGYRAGAASQPLKPLAQSLLSPSVYSNSVVSYQDIALTPYGLIAGQGAVTVDRSGVIFVGNGSTPSDSKILFKVGSTTYGYIQQTSGFGVSVGSMNSKSTSVYGDDNLFLSAWNSVIIQPGLGTIHIIGTRIIDPSSDTSALIYLSSEKINGTGSIGHVFAPHQDLYGDLGDATHRWGDIYGNSITVVSDLSVPTLNVGTLQAYTGSTINLGDHLIPNSDGAYNLGSANYSMNIVYANTVRVTDWFPLSGSEFTANGSLIFGPTFGIFTAILYLRYGSPPVDAFRLYAVATHDAWMETLNTALNGWVSVMKIVHGDNPDIAITSGTTLTLEGASLRVGTYSAIGAETLAGFITIKDSSGSSRKVAVVA